MRKKWFVLFWSTALVISVAGATRAAYVEIGSGGDLILEGLTNYTATAVPSLFRDLTPEDGAQEVDFFNVTFDSFDVSHGRATAIIQFLAPLIGNVQGSGKYGGIFTGYFQLGFLTWDDGSIDVSFGNDGLLRLALFDLAGLNIGNTVTLSGSIEILQESSPVPIPSAVLLLASGLIGLVGYKRMETRTKQRGNSSQV